MILRSLAPLRSGSFRLLWVAYLVSAVGDVLLEVGIMVTVFERTGSALQTVGVTVAMYLPRFVMGPVAGAWVDRYSRRRIMVLADLASAALVGSLLLVGTDRLVLLYAIVVGLGCITPLRRPARLALIPTLVPRQQLVAANSLMLATQQAAMALGYGLGGVLILTLGLERLVAIDLTSFVVAGIAVTLMRIPGGETARSEHQAEPLRQAMARGLTYLRNHELARALVGLEIFEHLPHGIWTSALMLVFTREALHGDAADWGYQNSLFFASTIVGAALAVAISGWVAQRPGWAIIADAFIGGVFTLGYALSPNLAVALVFCALMGPATALRDVAQDSLLQAGVDDAFMGRVQAMRTMGAQAVFMGGGVLFAWVADQLDVRWIYLTGGTLYLLTGLFALSSRAIRRSRIG
jgi:MFS family permease